MPKVIGSGRRTANTRYSNETLSICPFLQTHFNIIIWLIAESAIKKLRYIALDLIPPISQTNVESTILSNPKITFGDLKSLAIQLKRAECGVLNKLQLHCVGPSIKYDEDHPGWLTDAVIDDFHHLCVNSTKTVSLPSGSTHCFLELEDGATLPNTTLESVEIDYNRPELELILAPINLDQCHWVLGAFWIKSKEYACIKFIIYIS